MTCTLKGRPRRRAIARVRAEEPSCWLCGYSIDLTRNPQVDDLGSSVDEVVPRSKGGSTTDRDNLRHAHRICNSTRGNRPVTPELRAELRAMVTELLGITVVAAPSRSW